MRVLSVSGLLQKIKVKRPHGTCDVCPFLRRSPPFVPHPLKTTEPQRLDRLAAGGTMAAQAAGIWRETKKCKGGGGGYVLKIAHLIRLDGKRRQ